MYNNTCNNCIRCSILKKLFFIDDVYKILCDVIKGLYLLNNGRKRSVFCLYLIMTRVLLLLVYHSVTVTSCYL